jgi:hypothetical protein
MVFKSVIVFIILVVMHTAVAQNAGSEFQEATKKVIAAHKAQMKKEAAENQKFNQTVSIFSVKKEDAGNQSLYSVIEDSKPLVGDIMRVYMGDKMMLERRGYYAECITPNFSTNEKPMGGKPWFIKEGEPLCKMNSQSKGYTPSYVNVDSPDGDRKPVTVKYNKKKDTYKVCIKPGGFASLACKKDAKKGDLNEGYGFVSVESSMQRTIEYVGKSNGVVKFIYSEFIENMARDRFTREFEVNLSEGNTAAWKGAIFEIIEANNAEITYRIIRHFPN